MDKEINEIIDKIKDSANNPTIMMPSFDGSDEEEISNDTFINPIESKILLDYINNLQQQLKKKDEVIKKAIKVIEECKMLFSHEFDWGEQTDYLLQILEDKEVK